MRLFATLMLTISISFKELCWFLIMTIKVVTFQVHPIENVDSVCNRLWKLARKYDYMRTSIGTSGGVSHVRNTEPEYGK